MKILVTAAGTVIGQAIIKSIKAAELDAFIVALNADPLGAGLYWADSHYVVPRASDPNYLIEVKEIIKKERPNMIMIGIENEYRIFSEVRNELEKEFNTKVLASSKEVIDIAEDKWLTYTFLKDNDFEYPKSCLPGDEKLLLEEVGFPLIVKPRFGAESVGVHKVKSIDELYHALSSIDDAIIQDCVGTSEEEYTAGVIVFNGKAYSSITMKRELKYGNTSVAQAIEYSKTNKYLEKVAERLGVHGPVNLQYRLFDDKVKIFEINARFSGTTHFRTLCNVNEIEMCIRYLVTNQQIKQPDIKKRQVIRYYDEMVLPE